MPGGADEVGSSPPSCRRRRCLPAAQANVPCQPRYCVPLPLLQGVGHLLAFRNPAHEAAFTARFNSDRCQADAAYMLRFAVAAVVFNLMLLASHRWMALGGVMEACCLAAMGSAAARRHPFYLRHRSALLAFFHMEHLAMVGMNEVFGFGCRWVSVGVWGA